MEKGKANILDRARRDAERMVVPVIAKKKRLAEPKIARYRPGQAPDWVKGDEEDEAEEANQQPMEEVVVVRDRRLERLQDKPVSREEALRRRRERMAELVEEGEEEGVREVHPRQTPLGGGDLEEEEEDEEEEMDEEDREAELRRKQLRLQKIKLSEIAEQQVNDEPVEAAPPEEESSEYESYYSSDEQDTGWGVQVIQPVFVSKQDRGTIAERDALDAEVEERVKATAEREKERKAESKVMLKQELKREFEGAKKPEGEQAEVEEPEDEAAEYEAWKQRELARIRRDKQDKELFVAEMAEVERRRQMTDKEIEAEDAEVKPKEKGQMRFMQRYYHKGAYFRDGGQYDIGNVEKYMNNYLQPTGEDHFDKTALPKVLQVKNFGKAGRTKYTHLVDQDTTFNEAYSQKFYQHLAPLPPVEWKTKKGMGGVGEVGKRK